MDTPRKHGMETQVLVRALKDPSYRQRLMANPKAAIEEEVGARLADGTQVHVHEQKPGDIHLILPTVADPAALSDDELRRVADTSSTNYTSHFYTGSACSC
jgi:hypothetical protein